MIRLAVFISTLSKSGSSRTADTRRSRRKNKQISNTWYWNHRSAQLRTPISWLLHISQPNLLFLPSLQLSQSLLHPEPLALTSDVTPFIRALLPGSGFHQATGRNWQPRPPRETTALYRPPVPACDCRWHPLAKREKRTMKEQERHAESPLVYFIGFHFLARGWLVSYTC